MKYDFPAQMQTISDKVGAGLRINEAECLYLFEHGELAALGILANQIRESKNGNHTYFNRNIHLEPTNLCVFDCKFCSYSRTLKETEDGWFMSIDEMLQEVKKHDHKPITEVHIVGGVHPKLTLDFFCEALRQIHTHRPELHIKAFTAVELEYMFRKAKVSYTEGFQQLKAAGLGSLPGGGAEIFDADIRLEICADKCNAEQWLAIHQAAHESGIPSNATMLYGHIEQYHHRVDHMKRLRDLQDQTQGFNTFIPLKYRNENNELSHIHEVSTIEDLKMYAIARIYLDNFQHIKAYWPMIGRDTAQMSQAFGVDDIDGTIDDTTKIYTMAGSEEQSPTLSTEQLVQLILDARRTPIERDTLYHTVHDYSIEPISQRNYVELPVVSNTEL